MTVRSAILASVVLASAACAGGGNRGSDTAGLTSELTGDSAIGATPPAASESTVTAAPPAGGDPAAARPTPGSASTPRPPRPAGASPGAPPPSGSNVPAPSDTARGVVAVVGATPMTSVVIRPVTGRPITLRGPLANEIGVASGADVWVRGRRVDDRTIDVASYAVRTVDGVTAITGTLTADGDRLVLVTDDGRRHAIARPPAPLRQHVGARVWVTGDPATTINTYGVLRPRQ